ncbi:MAG: alpha-1,4-glucan--maltose-1-phosphate maltosyltransferase [Acidimicrobiia bacterium]
MARIPATTGRVVIEDVTPRLDGGRFAVKRIVGEQVSVEADVFADGHDAIGALVRHRKTGSRRWAETRMTPIGNDRWRAELTPDSLGVWQFEVEGWADPFATWLAGLEKKVGAEVDVTVDLLIGANQVVAAAARAKGKASRLLKKQATTLADPTLELTERLETAFSDELKTTMDAYPDRSTATRSGRYEIIVDRERARFSTWYELFPRSWAVEPGRHGTLADVTKQLGYMADMGFDVLYLPPIHPVGTTYRKGANNALRAKPDDPGVPWAIGSPQGGHTAISPDLGTIEDFRILRDTAAEHGLEIAMDIAFQCSPDHPWVKEHPDWFRHRPDGSIQYAENPPKKYQDIYPIDFETTDRRGLWAALKGVFDHWIKEEIRIFRVDNPHTKAFAFWEWVIAEIRSEHPDAIFLAEAFTRPKVMYRLAKLGFTQSYTYFAWRNTRHELVEYMGDLARVEGFFRPNFWPNTPDILTQQLQTGGRPTFITRYVLAATLGSNCGIYGPAFELMEHVPLTTGSEEYRDSEKYQIREWDFDDPHSLAPLITQVNKARHEHRALQRHDNLTFHHADNDKLLCFSKRTVGDVVLVVVNLDPDHAQAGWIDLDVEVLGVDPGHQYQLHDLLTDRRYLWEGSRNFVQLDPAGIPAHIFSVRRRVRSEQSFDHFL